MRKTYRTHIAQFANQSQALDPSEQLGGSGRR